MKKPKKFLGKRGWCNPSMYIEAANILSRGRVDGCCWAIYLAAGGGSTPEILTFVDLYQHDGVRCTGRSLFWFGDPYSKEARWHRIMALCLAAAIVESGGL